MRVLLFTDSEAFAGTERHMLDLACGLTTLGVEASVACPVPSALSERLPVCGVGVEPIQKRGVVDPAAVTKLFRLLRSASIDVVHSHNGRTALSAAIAVWLAGRGACVATQHFLRPNRVSRKGAGALTSRLTHSWTSRITARYLCISDAVCSEMLARGEAPPEKISVVPNGIADPRKGSLRSIAEIRREIGIEADTPLIVCAARLETEKSLATLISAMKHVRESYPNAHCVIAGEGTLEAELEKQIREMGLGDHVHLLGFRSDVISLINAADIFVLPSLAEPFGLVILEAMALGKAVVATDAGGPKEIVVEGRTGHLVPALSSEALGAAICGLIGDSERRMRFGAEGRNRYEENFTSIRMAERTLEVYRKALTPASAGRRVAIDDVRQDATLADVR